MAAQAQASGGGGGGRAKASVAPARPYQPGKLGRAGARGLPPQLVLGVAGLSMVIAAGMILFTGGRGQAIVDTVGLGFARQAAGAGFKVAAVNVEGATPMARADIVRALDLAPGAPILALDLPQLRSRVLESGWARDAQVVRLLPDTVSVTVAERKAMAVWQSGGLTQVIDGDGAVIARADPGGFGDLPLVVGRGAEASAGVLLPVLHAHGRLMGRLEALVRVDERRWDLRLKDGTLIQLPAVDEASALMRLDRLDQERGILSLGLARIDLRDPDTLVVRPREAPAPAAASPAAGGI